MKSTLEIAIVLVLITLSTCDDFYNAYLPAYSKFSVCFWLYCEKCSPDSQKEKAYHLLTENGEIFIIYSNYSSSKNYVLISQEGDQGVYNREQFVYICNSFSPSISASKHTFGSGSFLSLANIGTVKYLQLSSFNFMFLRANIYIDSDEYFIFQSNLNLSCSKLDYFYGFKLGSLSLDTIGTKSTFNHFQIYYIVSVPDSALSLILSNPSPQIIDFEKYIIENSKESRLLSPILSSFKFNINPPYILVYFLVEINEGVPALNAEVKFSSNSVDYTSLVKNTDKFSIRKINFNTALVFEQFRNVTSTPIHILDDAPSSLQVGSFIVKPLVAQLALEQLSNMEWVIAQISMLLNYSEDFELLLDPKNNGLRFVMPDSSTPAANLFCLDYTFKNSNFNIFTTNAMQAALFFNRNFFEVIPKIKKENNLPNTDLLIFNTNSKNSYLFATKIDNTLLSSTEFKSTAITFNLEQRVSGKYKSFNSAFADQSKLFKLSKYITYLNDEPSQFLMLIITDLYNKTNPDPYTYADSILLPAFYTSETLSEPTFELNTSGVFVYYYKLSSTSTYPLSLLIKNKNDNEIWKEYKVNELTSSACYLDRSFVDSSRNKIVITAILSSIWRITIIPSLNKLNWFLNYKNEILQNIQTKLGIEVVITKKSISNFHYIFSIEFKSTSQMKPLFLDCNAGIDVRENPYLHINIQTLEIHSFNLKDSNRSAIIILNNHPLATILTVQKSENVNYNPLYKTLVLKKSVDNFKVKVETYPVQLEIPFSFSEIPAESSKNRPIRFFKTNVRFYIPNDNETEFDLGLFDEWIFIVFSNEFTGEFIVNETSQVNKGYFTQSLNNYDTIEIRLLDKSFKFSFKTESFKIYSQGFKMKNQTDLIETFHDKNYNTASHFSFISSNLNFTDSYLHAYEGLQPSDICSHKLCYSASKSCSDVFLSDKCQNTFLLVNALNFDFQQDFDYVLTTKKGEIRREVKPNVQATYDNTFIGISCFYTSILGKSTIRLDCEATNQIFIFPVHEILSHDSCISFMASLQTIFISVCNDTLYPQKYYISGYSGEDGLDYYLMEYNFVRSKIMNSDGIIEIISTQSIFNFANNFHDYNESIWESFNLTSPKDSSQNTLISSLLSLHMRKNFMTKFSIENDVTDVLNYLKSKLSSSNLTNTEFNDLNAGAILLEKVTTFSQSQVLLFSEILQVLIFTEKGGPEIKCYYETIEVVINFINSNSSLTDDDNVLLIYQAVFNYLSNTDVASLSNLKFVGKKVSVYSVNYNYADAVQIENGQYKLGELVINDSKDNLAFIFAKNQQPNRICTIVIVNINGVESNSDYVYAYPFLYDNNNKSSRLDYNASDIFITASSNITEQCIWSSNEIGCSGRIPDYFRFSDKLFRFEISFKNLQVFSAAMLTTIIILVLLGLGLVFTISQDRQADSYFTCFKKAILTRPYCNYVEFIQSLIYLRNLTIDMIQERSKLLISDKITLESIINQPTKMLFTICYLKLSIQLNQTLGKECTEKLIDNTFTQEELIYIKSLITSYERTVQNDQQISILNINTKFKNDNQKIINDVKKYLVSYIQSKYEDNFEENLMNSYGLSKLELKYIDCESKYKINFELVTKQVRLHQTDEMLDRYLSLVGILTLNPWLERFQMLFQFYCQIYFEPIAIFSRNQTHISKSNMLFLFLFKHHTVLGLIYAMLPQEFYSNAFKSILFSLAIYLVVSIWFSLLYFLLKKKKLPDSKRKDVLNNSAALFVLLRYLIGFIILFLQFTYFTFNSHTIEDTRTHYYFLYWLFAMIIYHGLCVLMITFKSGIKALMIDSGNVPNSKKWFVRIFIHI